MTKRTKKPAFGFLDALKALRAGLTAAAIPSAFIGGVAVIARGVARFTVDIDATVLASATDPDALLATLKTHEIGPRIENVARFARAHQVLLLQHLPSRVPLDISLAWLPFEERAIRAARSCTFAGVRIRTVTAEDLLIYKLIAHRPRDLDDAERLLVLHAARLDFGRVRQALKALAEALEGPDRLVVLETLRRRVGPTTRRRGVAIRRRRRSSS